MAGHVSKEMLKHYSHIRMEAKRRAVSAGEKSERAKRKRARTLQMSLLKISLKSPGLN